MAIARDVIHDGFSILSRSIRLGPGAQSSPLCRQIKSRVTGRRFSRIKANDPSLLPSPSPRRIPLLLFTLSAGASLPPPILRLVPRRRHRCGSTPRSGVHRHYRVYLHVSSLVLDLPSLDIIVENSDEGFKLLRFASERLALSKRCLRERYSSPRSLQRNVPNDAVFDRDLDRETADRVSDSDKSGCLIPQMIRRTIRGIVQDFQLCSCP